MKKLICPILIIFFLAIVTAQSQPNPPHQFYGDVIVNNNVAPDGMTIEARIDNETFSSVTTNGRYGVIPNIIKIPFEIGRGGKLIEFFIIGVGCTEKAPENATFESGAITRLDLSYNVPEECIPKPPVQETNSGDSGNSGGGNSGGGSSSGGSVISRNKLINATNSTSREISSIGIEDNSENEIRQENSDEEINNKKFFPTILGAVIGPGGALSPLAAILFVFVIFALVLIIVFIRRKNRNSIIQK